MKGKEKIGQFDLQSTNCNYLKQKGAELQSPLPREFLVGSGIKRVYIINRRRMKSTPPPNRAIRPSVPGSGITWVSDTESILI